MMELWLPSRGGPPPHRISQPLKAGATDDGRNVLIWIGISSGLFGFHRLGKLTGAISGLILIFIGVYEIFF